MLNGQNGTGMVGDRQGEYCNLEFVIWRYVSRFMVHCQLKAVD